MSRIDKTLESLSAVKNLELFEVIALLQCLGEKVKSSQDFAHQEKAEFFVNFLEDVTSDCMGYQLRRKEWADIQAADDASDPKFAHYGDQTYADKETA